MSQPYDVIIIGAGIVGCACANECAKAGLRVLLIDRGAVGAGTTAAGMGHIVVLDDSPTQMEFCTYARNLWAQRAEQTVDELEWEQRGTLWVATDDEEMEMVQKKHNLYTANGIDTTVLNADELAKVEPNLRPGLCGGLVVKNDAVLYPPAAAKHLADEAVAHGAETLLYTEVHSIQADGRVVLKNGTTLSAGIVVNAAGCWSPELTEGLNVFKRKGHLVVTNRYPDLINHQIIELGYLKSAHTVKADSVAFNIQPRKDGKILIGSSRQSGDESTEVDYAILGKMLRRTFEFVPKLRQAWALRCWTGFRPATIDKLPLIGPTPYSEKIWLATGHEGLGITTSLATGRLLADQLLNRTSAISIEPFLPSRYANGART